MTVEHRDKVCAAVDRAQEQGAAADRRARSRRRRPRARVFLGPPIVDEVTNAMNAYVEEVFRPALVLLRAATLDDAIARQPQPAPQRLGDLTPDGRATRAFQLEVQAGVVGVKVPSPCRWPAARPTTSRPVADVRAAELWSRGRAELAECPRWDADARRLLWVDVTAGRVLARDGAAAADDPAARPGDPPSATNVLIELPGRVSAVVQRVGGGLLVANDVDVVLTDGAGAVEQRIAVEQAGAGRVLNDGTCDAAGRFWVGSAVIDGGPARAGLFRVDARGVRAEQAGDLIEGNGIGWSPAGDRLYLVDSGTRRLDALAVDPADGTLGQRRTLLHVEGGIPDGLAVDGEGCVWLAIWDGGEVRRLDPEGRLLERVGVPARRPTSCAFGGEQLRDLFVTSARMGIADADAEDPLAGSIFRLPDAGAGLPALRTIL